MIMKLLLMIKIILLEKEKEQIQIRQMGQQPTQISHEDRILVAFSIVKIRLRHVHILNVKYSGALARKARQRSTMGKKMR